MDFTHIAVNGIRLHVATAGPAHAPLVVLLHGFPETALAWRRYVDPLLALGWRVAVPDQRGYGASDKPGGVRDYVLDVLADDVCALGAALGAEQFAVVGHDWGGMVAWHLAARHPEVVERLAILNAPHPASFLGYALTHPFQLARSAYVGLFQLPLVPEALLSVNGFSLLAASLTRTSKPGTFDDELLAAYRQAWQAPRAIASMLNWYRAMALARPVSTLIEAPTLILWGGQDAALEAGLADEALAYCARGKLERLPDATHWLHHEQPVRVGALLCDFLAQPATAGAAG
ncbi:alpha/beta hydrolase [Variovorax sp. J22G73]|uniref:alpha/beta fold hydrolase n=1 Tax=unclassified Variovorax TaxID=663243 RepID=UPI002576FC03|nr:MULTISPECIES: alpha/beta hydrolase [unclassified Variovorax]MDM0009505.1 alpha/beta hydrolase [Variovorax sp. J22R203]MDM0102013.1 alpha/beta hydrolase [Variovorax sp. J22G73]